MKIDLKMAELPKKFLIKVVTDFAGSLLNDKIGAQFFPTRDR